MTSTAHLLLFMALSMALAALGSNVMLPVFPSIREAYGLPADSTAVAMVTTAYFLGLGTGQLVYGPVADRFGRRATLYIGYGVYAAGALAGLIAPSLNLLLLSRVLWGLGAAGPRVVTQAAIRDRFAGEDMARALSLVMSVFVLVPIVAPMAGAAVVAVTSWRWVFGACVVAVGSMAVWARWLPETLHEEYRRPLRFAPVTEALRHVVSDPLTVFYTLAGTVLFGVFTSWLSSSEIIIRQIYGLGDAYPFIFGSVASAMAVAMLVNARTVRRVGARPLAHRALLAHNVATGALLALVLATGGRPPLLPFLAGLALVLGFLGLLYPNLTTVAMQRMAPVAGTAASVIGAVQIAGGSLLGSVIDRAYDGTVRPLALGFFASSILALLFVLRAERGRLFRPLKTAE